MSKPWQRKAAILRAPAAVLKHLQPSICPIPAAVMPRKKGDKASFTDLSHCCSQNSIILILAESWVGDMAGAIMVELPSVSPSEELPTQERAKLYFFPSPGHT